LNFLKIKIKIKIKYLRSHFDWPIITKPILEHWTCPKLPPTLYVYIVVIAKVVQKYCLLLFSLVCVLGLIHGCAQTHFEPMLCKFWTCNGN
jgi:hypothetical protein